MSSHTIGAKQRISSLAISELTKNIRRNIRHMHAELEPGNNRDSRLIDYLLHMDTLAQEIETELETTERDSLSHV